MFVLWLRLRNWIERPTWALIRASRLRTHARFRGALNVRRHFPVPGVSVTAPNVRRFAQLWYVTSLLDGRFRVARDLWYDANGLPSKGVAPMKHVLATAILAVSLIGHDAKSQSTEYKLGQIVVARKAIMFDFQTAFWTLMAVKNGESADYGAAAMAARLVEESMPSFVELLEPGTARGEAPGSRVKPEVWSQAQDFAAAADDLQAKAAALAAASATESPEIYAEAFEELNQACTACHGLRPSSGGPFRFAKDE